jgi:hypothetical protein
MLCYISSMVFVSVTTAFAVSHLSGRVASVLCIMAMIASLGGDFGPP